MSDEENNEAPARADYPSPLRSLITELHEVYQELRIVGFPRQTADSIVANILFDAMLSRPLDENDYDDYDDDDDDDNDKEDNNDIGV